MDSGKAGVRQINNHEALAWAERAWQTQIIISYFFNAHSHQLARSSLGLYRSLLYQLVSTYEEIRTFFLAKFSLKERDTKIVGWSEAEYEQFFIEIVTISYLPSLNIFIDALDACHEIDNGGIVEFFEHLRQRSILSGLLLRVCFSSRHYPHIGFRHELSIVTVS